MFTYNSEKVHGSCWQVLGRWSSVTWRRKTDHGKLLGICLVGISQVIYGRTGQHVPYPSRVHAHCDSWRRHRTLDGNLLPVCLKTLPAVTEARWHTVRLAVVLMNARITSTSDLFTLLTNERHWKHGVRTESKQRGQHVRRLSADDAVSGRVQRWRTTALYTCTLETYRQQNTPVNEHVEFFLVNKSSTADQAGFVLRSAGRLPYTSKDLIYVFGAVVPC